MQRNPILLALAVLLAAALPARGQCSVQPLAALAAVQHDQQFGTAVALQGDELFVGAWAAELGSGDFGHVALFRRDGESWVSNGTLAAGEGMDGLGFGEALALQGDRLVVGAPSAFTNGVLRGAAYVYERVGGTWTKTARLLASDGAGFDQFGWSVALDGDRIVVGSLWATAGFSSGAGAAYVFDKSPGGWTQVAKLQPAGLHNFDHFGWGCAVSGDSVVVGKPGDNSSFGPGGRAYVFTRAADGAWPLTQTLQGDNPAGDFLGMRVVAQGDTLLVSAHLEKVSGISFAGAVYAFQRQGGSYVKLQRLIAHDPAIAEFFGASLALDGERAAIGGGLNGAKAEPPGAAQLFARTDGSWSRSWHVAPPASLAVPACFGGAVALEGETLVVGANVDSSFGTEAGQAFAIDLGALHAPFGEGVAGKGGFVPELLGTTCDQAGALQLQLRLRLGRGGAPCLLLAGAASGQLPFAGGAVLVAPPWRTYPLVLGGAPGLAGAGQLDLAADVPGGAALPPIVAQFLVLDAAAPAGVALSRGLMIPALAADAR